MNLSQLTRKEMNVIKECLDATVEGPFFEEWEFHSLLGVDRLQVKRVADNWPNISLIEDSELIIHNALGNLIGYPHGKDRLWDEYISVPRERLEDMFYKIKD